jgi:hypothetical protein
MTIDWAALGEEVEAHDVLLEAVAYDPRADVLEISALRPSASGPTVLRHEISGPEAVEIDSPVGIVPATLRITGADGAVTVARITNPPELSS